jgi:hypothetical protein
VGGTNLAQGIIGGSPPSGSGAAVVSSPSAPTASSGGAFVASSVPTSSGKSLADQAYDFEQQVQEALNFSGAIENAEAAFQGSALYEATGWTFNYVRGLL